MNDVLVWDGANCKEIPKVEIAYLIAKLAHEYGWSKDQILDITLKEAAAMLEQIQRVNYESAYFTALAFNYPERLMTELEEIHDKNLSDRERWQKNLSKLRNGIVNKRTNDRAIKPNKYNKRRH